jgi:hypothetical protein
MKESKVLLECREIMQVIIKSGFTNQIHKRELEKIIMTLRGMDRRTIRNWVKTLEVMGFVRVVNASVFQLNFDGCKDLLFEVYKNNGQKKLM